MVSIKIPGKGLARGQTETTLQWRYADLWSSEFTWGAVLDENGVEMYSGGGKPKGRDVVSIPSGQTVVLDEDTPTLKMLLING